MSPHRPPAHTRRHHRYLRVARKRTVRALQGHLNLETVPHGIGKAIGTTLDLLPLDANLLTKQGPERTQALNRQLAWSMAFIAGAINAGGFLAVKSYTSHVSGTFSKFADELARGRMRLAYAALQILVCFTLGAFTAGTLINLGRRLKFRAHYALSLMIEAGLMLLFGLMGATLSHRQEFFLPMTVILLSFMMGMHNSVVTSISNAEVRTTHMTGNLTDFGIELSRLVYPNVFHRRGSDPIRANRNRLKLHGLILLSFAGGGVAGAVGFRHVGYKVTVFLATFLFVLAVRPVVHELRVRLRMMGGLPDYDDARALARDLFIRGR
ncbi:YoaK family protein [Mesoterricola silvestris]|uniref:DUF1275 domain-containing protein n=1 Tax=Mesoterricola silvestris TaxID=2927979 RepID=A0AA48GTT9_9BACT|nr:YoaK family protein [Mesoterricola silvestris]BDU71641.1 hypothetical protein METEAL_08150 [Mesoterricola silvestris]